MNLPAQYDWLAKEPGPRMLIEALRLIGTKEVPGAKDNPTIIAWAKEVGGSVDDIYTDDSIPWCGLFAAVIAKRAGWEIPARPLWALAWSDWGNRAETPMLSDILTFKRKGGGHVGLYVGEDRTHFHVLGGNQRDSVSIVRIERSRLAAARRAPWKLAQPANVRVVKLAATGTVSTNEA